MWPNTTATPSPWPAPSSTPLTFQATGPVTLLEAITRAGGLALKPAPKSWSPAPSPARTGARPLVQRILVKGLIDAADPALNIVLTGGEEIRVPESGKVYVIGNVKMPGAYPMGDGTESTVLKMLALSQGLMPLCRQRSLHLPPRRQRQQERNSHPAEQNHGAQSSRHAPVG
jgi:protein involved in polysaccharide export with SLBB domain